MCQSLAYPDSCYECGHTLRGDSTVDHFKNPITGNCEAWCDKCVDAFNKKVVS